MHDQFSSSAEHEKCSDEVISNNEAGERIGRSIGGLLARYRGESKDAMTGTVTIQINAKSGEGGEGFRQEVPFKIDPATLTTNLALHGVHFSSSNVDIEEPKKGLFIFRLRGNFIGADETDVHALVQTMKATIESAKSPRVVVSCKLIERLASDGIVPPLLALWKKIGEKNGKMGLCDVPEELQELLARTHLNKVFPISATEADAKKAMRGRRNARTQTA